MNALKSILKTTVFLGMLMVSEGLFAQFAVVLDNIDGRPVTGKLHGEVQGEPNFFKDWTKATVHLSNGEKLGNVSVKYDLIDDLLIFTDQTGQLYYFKHPVNEFWLHPAGEADLHFRSGFPDIDGRFSSNFYQVLVDGNVALLKSYRKNLQEAQAYGSTAKSYYLNDSEVLYVYVDKQLKKVRKNEKAILDALSNQELKAAAQRHIAQQKLNLRRDEDLVTLFRLLNAN